MLIKILIGVLLVIAAVLLFAATKPNTLRVQRSIEIGAPPAKIFALINDFREWPRWAPQDREDPTMVRTYSGAASGVGAVSDWQGSGSTGSGRMEIVESSPDAFVSVKVDFSKPFVAHNLNRLALTPEGKGTRVTWTMDGSNLYIMKLMSVL
jgi:carbon monoxide dehydrogenase subunit G